MEDMSKPFLIVMLWGYWLFVACTWGLGRLDLKKQDRKKRDKDRRVADE